MQEEAMGTPDKMAKNEMGDEKAMARGTVEALARNAAAREAERASWAPTNMDSNTVLARRAQQMNLGDVKTGELSLSWAGEDYIVQGFAEGILYAEDGKPETAR